MSLRTRLVVTVLGLLALGLAIASVGTYYALRAFLIDRIDSELRGSAYYAGREFAQDMADGVLDEEVEEDSEKPAADVEFGPTFIQIRTPGGRTLYTSATEGAEPRLPESLPLVEASRSERGVMLTVDSSSPDYRYRVVVTALPRGEGYLVAGVSLASVEETLHRLAGIMLGVGAVVLAAMVLLARRSIRRGLRPLEDIGETARAIGAGDLARRVGPAGSRTEVGRLGLALNAMLHQIEAAFREREASEERLRRFVADASHELRTPLASIRGYAELFRRGARTRGADLATAMRRIEQESRRMGVLVDELLLLARLDQGRPLEMVPLDLSLLVADAVADARAVEPGRSIALVCPGPVRLRGDEPRLREVLANLLDNVRQHTPPDAPAWVSLSARDGLARVEVEDSGPALTAEQRERVFERFYRADPSRARARGGSGLGLSIVAAVVAAHGGRAGVSAVDGRGSTFWIELPVDRSAGLPGGPPDQPPSPADRLTPERTGSSQVFSSSRTGGPAVLGADSGSSGRLEVTDPMKTPKTSPTPPASPMTTVAGFALRHRGVVVLVWLAVLVAGIAASGRLADRLSQSFTFPGTAGYEDNIDILRAYGTGGPGTPLVPVVRLPEGTTADDPATRQILGTAFDRLAERESLRVVSYPSTGEPGFVGEDGRTVFGLVFIPFTGEAEGVDPALVDGVAATLRGALPEAANVEVTGLSALLGQQGEGNRGGGGILVETLIGAAGALIVLAFVFGSFLALVPLLIAAVSILGTNLLLYGLAGTTDIIFIVQYVVALIGLGVSIDYSLLVVTRWREEVSRGRDSVEAVRRAVATAGRAVVLSGITVAVGLLTLLVAPVPGVRSIGYGSLLVPLMATLASLTLLPVILATAGRRLDWPRLRKERTASRLWTRWAGGVSRRPALATLAALVLLVPLGLAVLGMRLGYAPAEVIPGQGGAQRGFTQLETSGMPSGVLTPIEVMVPANADAEGLAERLAEVPGVHAAFAPDGPDWRREGVALVEVLPEADTGESDGREITERVRGTALAEIPAARVGGTGALDIDSTEQLYRYFPFILVGIALITFIVLARAFRSLVLALQAVVVNLLSIAAAYGVLVLIWQEGYGSTAIWDIEALGSVTAFVPLITFAFLYGLSMDYEVFLLSRMREEYDETGSTRAAVVEGLGRIGRLVTSAALILFLAFVALASVPEVDVKVMATGLGAGILIDATILRALLVPALVSLTGRWTWWLPPWAARVLRVPPTPVTLPATAGAVPHSDRGSPQAIGLVEGTPDRK